MHQHKRDLTSFPATVRAAKQAFAMAGMTPSDIDVAEVHDYFTGIELISYEDLGFAEKFEAFKLIESGGTGVEGSLPVNPSGGLNTKGHPPGAPELPSASNCSSSCVATLPTRWTELGSGWRTMWEVRLPLRP